MLNFPIRADNERRWIFQSCRMMRLGSISALSVTAREEREEGDTERAESLWPGWMNNGAQVQHLCPLKKFIVLIHQGSGFILDLEGYIGNGNVSISVSFIPLPFLLSSLIYCLVLLKFSESSRFCEIKETKHNDLNFLLGPATNTRFPHSLTLPSTNPIQVGVIIRLQMLLWIKMWC